MDDIGLIHVEGDAQGSLPKARNLRRFREMTNRGQPTVPSFQFTRHFLVIVRLMIVIVGQHRMNLRQRQVRMLQTHLRRSGAMCQPVLNYLDNLDVGIINPRPPLGVGVNASSATMAAL